MLNQYKTTDIVLAAVLKMLGYKLENIEIEGRRGTFIFANVNPHSVDEFNYDGVRVEPKEFHAHVRTLSATINRMANNG